MYHNPVMLYESLKNLDIVQDGFYFDCTFGLGGHSLSILKYLCVNSSLHSIDKDFSFFNLNFLKKNNFLKKINFHQCSFDKFIYITSSLNLLNKVNGILIDLGVSSNHFYDFKRGFGFLNDGFLDMRLCSNDNFRAIDWFNLASFDELIAAFYFMNKSNYSFALVKEILSFRKNRSIKTVEDFRQIINKVVSNSVVFNKIFQSIRVFINNDFQALFDILSSFYFSLASTGRLVIISFNSFEDLIIKSFFYKSNFFKRSYVNFLKPSIFEISNNFASRSAIMRVFIKD